MKLDYLTAKELSAGRKIQITAELIYLNTAHWLKGMKSRLIYSVKNKDVEYFFKRNRL